MEVNRVTTDSTKSTATSMGRRPAKRCSRDASTSDEAGASRSVPVAPAASMPVDSSRPALSVGVALDMARTLFNVSLIKLAPVEVQDRIAPKGAPVLDVVVPVYNEEGALGECVDRLHAHLSEHLPFEFRITVADNASTDSTL